MTNSIGTIDSKKPKECFVNDGFIVIPDQYCGTIVYVESEPLESKEKLFLSFASIDPESETQIINFYDSYGNVGDISKEVIGSPPLEIGHAFAKLIDIKCEISILKNLLMLKESIDDEDCYNAMLSMKSILLANNQKSESNKYFKGVRDLVLRDSASYHDFNINSLENINSPNSLLGVDSRFLDNVMNQLLQNKCPDQTFESVKLKAVQEVNDALHLSYSVNTDKFIAISKAFLQGVINSHLNDVDPVLMRFRENYKTQWRCKGLLPAMYLQLAFSISENKIFKKCRCSTCDNYFEVYGNDTRKIYCSVHCAQLEAKRKQRTRQKEKKEVSQ